MKNKQRSNASIAYNITQWEKSYVRDNLGVILPCYWNNMVKQEVLRLEATKTYKRWGRK